VTTYRTGRHNERTIYIQGGPEPERTDVQVGTMDTPELGRLVALALNTMNAMVRGRAEVPPRDSSVPQSCQDANGQACAPDRCELNGPHYASLP
jgi:hypothetical protein